jgi:hypothetical protein
MQTSEKTVALRLPKAPGIRAGALLAVALAAFFVVWFALKGGGKHGAASPQASNAVAASEPDLKKLAGSLDHPIYWAGPAAGATYELTRLADGRIYIRYLASSDEIGDPRPNYLVVGTYPRPHAFRELKRAARQKGAVRRRLAHGGLLYFSSTRPTNVYFGYPDAHYQVEVYDPSGRTARQLVLTGRIRPIK